MDRATTFRVAVRKFGPFESAIAKQWESFEAEAKTGLVLDAVAMDLHPMEDALFASGGMVRGDWDVCFVATDWIAAMHDAKAAVNLAPLLASVSDFPAAWVDSLLRLQRIGDAVLGVPYHDGPECLICRTDLFADEGLQHEYRRQFHKPLALPETWDEFHQIARFLNSAEQGRYGTVFAAYPDGHNSVYDFLLQLWTRGGELVAQDGRICFQTKEAVDALTFYRTMLRDASAVHPSCGEFDSVKAGFTFAAGEVAMMVNWFGFAALAHTWEESKVRGKVDIATIPHGPGGRSVSLNVYWILSIAAGSPHRDVAWRFLRHCMGAEMDKLTTMEGAIGCRRSTWFDEEVNRAIPFYHRMAELHRVAREIPQMKAWPRVAAIIDELITATVNSDVPVEDLLDAADRKAAVLELSA